MTCQRHSAVLPHFQHLRGRGADMNAEGHTHRRHTLIGQCLQSLLSGLDCETFQIPATAGATVLRTLARSHPQPLFPLE